MYILLVLLWIALNGKVTLEIVLFGIFIAAAVYAFMCICLEYSPNYDKIVMHSLGSMILYFFVLVIEIVKAGITVLKLVLKSEIDIDPQIVIFRVPLKNEFLKTMLANSITLTPGTITLNVEDDVFYVHALDYTMSEGIEDSIFVQLLMKIEKKMEAKEND